MEFSSGIFLWDRGELDSNNLFLHFIFENSVTKPDLTRSLGGLKTCLKNKYLP